MSSVTTGTPFTTSIVVGIYSTSNGGVNIGVACIPIASTSSTTMTINTDTTIGLSGYSLTGTATVHDMVQEVC
jgi:hypothetical protein